MSLGSIPENVRLLYRQQTVAVTLAWYGMPNVQRTNWGALRSGTLVSSRDADGRLTSL